MNYNEVWDISNFEEIVGAAKGYLAMWIRRDKIAQ